MRHGDWQRGELRRRPESASGHSPKRPVEIRRLNRGDSPNFSHSTRGIHPRSKTAEGFPG
ncbi:MAG: hypothetical protein LBU45_05075 [Azoarcus sp.]|jgi:hypothetical protein|nr:hypothetical protein [Azoarcus sp.]